MGLPAPRHILCACPKPRTGLQTLYVVVFYVQWAQVKGPRSINFFFYIGGIVDHHCLSFFFLHNIVYHANSIITNNMHGLVICHRIRSKLISPIPLPTKGQWNTHWCFICIILYLRIERMPISLIQLHYLLIYIPRLKTRILKDFGLCYLL